MDCNNRHRHGGAAWENRVYGQVALLMAGIVVLSAVITLLTGTAQHGKAKTRIVASFYPVYVAALNLTQGIDDVELVSLTGPQTGCLGMISSCRRIT